MAGLHEAEAAAGTAPSVRRDGAQDHLPGQGGQGAVMKLAVNALIHGINQTLAEAMTLAEAAGIRPPRPST